MCLPALRFSGASMGYNTIEVEKDEGKVIITLNNPDKRNALDCEMSSELDDALSKCEDDDSVKVIIITGAGKAFCAGGDVKAMAETIDPKEFLANLSGCIHQLVTRIWNMEKVVIAAINGHAVGAGCGLAMACDLRYASDKAKINMGFMGMGLAPGVGTYFLPKLVGRAKAGELIYLNDTIDVKEAKKIGLINDYYDQDKLMEKVLKIAGKIEKGPALAIGRAKTLIRLSERSQLSEHLEAERYMISVSGETDDFREGVTAFLEKRKPNFKGK